MRRFWSVFSQSVTISLAILFVLRLFYPHLLNPQQSVAEAKPPQIGTINSYRIAAARAMPSVVNIFTSKQATQADEDNPLFRQFFGDQPSTQPKRENSLGSGVIVGADGLILTNHHVVESADEIEVALADGRTLAAKMVGSDPETDIAVIKVDAQDLPAITLSQNPLNVGDVVLAIGNPFGVGQTVTQGIVSALGRNHLGINTYENFIQTDATINPGNSGGALVDVEGELVGVSSAIYSKSGGSMGIGFAIPVNIVQQVMDQIVATGSVTRGWLGVEAQDMSEEIAQSLKLSDQQGALVTGVLQGGPADKAGIKPGDILLNIDGHTVSNGSEMLNLIAALKPGSHVSIKLEHNGKKLTTQALIARRPTPQKDSRN
ncbi:MAG TPA: trypsin-like peptidase domain-containing protein [Methylophilaceae bacterium]